MEKRLEVGVFLSCLRIEEPLEALKKVKEMGFRVVQLGMESFSEDREKRKALKETLKELDLKVVTFFAGFSGADWTDISTIRKTVGFADEERLEERVELSKKVADLAGEIGAEAMAAHIGFIPEDRNSSLYKKMLSATGDVIDHCQKREIYFAFETGQETPEELLAFIQALNRENTRVNFDTANLTLYGKGYPLPGIRVLKDYIISVHAKDGLWPKEKGKLGKEVPLGEGEANIKECVKELIKIGYQGPLIIEREAGEDRIGDILRAKEYLENIMINN